MLIVWGSMALYPALCAAFPLLGPQILFVMWAGTCIAGCDVLLFNRMYQIFPRAERPTLFSFHQVILNLAAFVAPLVSTGLVDQFGPRPVLGAISVIGLIGGALIYGLGWRGSQTEAAAAPAETSRGARPTPALASMEAREWFSHLLPFGAKWLYLRETQPVFQEVSDVELDAGQMASVTRGSTGRCRQREWWK
jgi:MFS family permease